jgi:tau tubulin kinase
LYVLIEFVKGSLPWRKVKDKDQIGEMKIQHNNAELVGDLPSEFLLFMEHLQTLRYMDKPDYNYLYGLLQDLCRRMGIDDNTPFDWEVSPALPIKEPSSSKGQVLQNLQEIEACGLQ